MNSLLVQTSSFTPPIVLHLSTPSTYPHPNKISYMKPCQWCPYYGGSTVFNTKGWVQEGVWPSYAEREADDNLCVKNEQKHPIQTAQLGKNFLYM